MITQLIKFMQFVLTDMGAQINPRFVEATGGFVAMDDIIKGKKPNYFVKFSAQIENYRTSDLIML